MKNRNPVNKKKQESKLTEKNQKNTPVKDKKEETKKGNIKNAPYVEDDVDMHDETSQKIKSRDEARNKNTEEDEDEHQANETRSETDEKTTQDSDEHNDQGPHE